MLYLLEVINAAIVSLGAFYMPESMRTLEKVTRKCQRMCSGGLIKIGFLTLPPLHKHNGFEPLERLELLH